jgi:hypothetical protein
MRVSSEPPPRTRLFSMVRLQLSRSPVEFKMSRSPVEPKMYLTRTLRKRASTSLVETDRLLETTALATNTSARPRRRAEPRAM